MTKKIFCFYIFITLCLPSFAQELAIKGTIQNSKTKEPVPFAHCVFVGTNKGFVADLNGKFNEKTTQSSYEIKVSAIGYKTSTFLISSDAFNVVELEPDVAVLSEVVVSYKDRERELLQKVLNNIPQNYPQQAEKLKGTIIEQLAQDSLYKFLLYSAEANIEADKLSYLKENRFGNVKIAEGKVNYFLSLDSSFTKIMAGAHNVHRFDIIAARIEPFDKIESSSYEFELTDTLSYSENVLFKMKFNTSKYYGFLYIQDKSFALVKAEYFAQKKKLSSFGSDYNRLFLHFTTEYYKEDSLFRLSYINYRTGFEEDKSNADKKIYLNNFFYLKEFNKLESLISYNQQANFEDILIDVLPIDTTTKIQGEAQIGATKKPAAGKQSYYQKFLRKFTIQESVGLLVNPSLQNERDIAALGITKLPNPTTQYFLLVLKLGYEFSNSIALEYVLGGSFRSEVISLNALQLKYNKPLSSNRRWILSISAGANYTVSNFQLGKVSTNKGELNNTFFNEGLVEIKKEIKQFNAITELQLAYRVGSRYHVTLEAAVPFNFQQNEVIQIIQEESTATIKGTDAQFSPSYYLIGLGFQMKF